MQRLITFGVTVDLVADFASILSDASPVALTASLLAGLLPATVAICRFFLPAEDSLAEFRAEPIRR